MEVDLRVEIGPLRLQNPVMPAAGTFGYGDEYMGIVDPRDFGALVTKSLSLDPTEGNPPPRLWEVPGGLINSIGLENIGVEAFIQQKLPFLRELGVPLIVSFFGQDPKDYARCAERLSEAVGIAALEANLSCPNVKKGGMAFGSDPELTHRVVEGIKGATDLPLLVKLPPDPYHALELARAAQEAGAEALTLVNTLPALAVDPDRGRPRLGGVTGGLSGPALKPVALRIVYQVSGALPIPVIGVGGIRDHRDAIEFVLAGATAVQVGTATFSDPKAIPKVIDGLRSYLWEHGLSSLADIRGKLHEAQVEAPAEG